MLRFEKYHVGNMHMRLMRLVNIENNDKANMNNDLDHNNDIGNTHMRLMRLVKVQNDKKVTLNTLLMMKITLLKQVF